ncbi:MAG TPA: AAA family ATPase [Rhizobiaceae bacterium]|nr:AAA family ATPase [Rhizobiaceae bacterium]
MKPAPTELDNICAVDFLLKLDPTGRHNIVAIEPDGPITGRTFEPGDRAGMEAFVEQHNGVANLYYSDNEPKEGAPHKKLAKSDIAAVRVVHGDIDPDAGGDMAVQRDKALALVQSLPVPPSIITDSGGGIQVFWRLAEKVPVSDGDTQQIEALNDGVCAAIGGDPAVKNIDRIMRLPFTVNIPTKSKLKKHPGRQPRMAMVISDGGPCHSVIDLQAVFSAPIPPTRLEKKLIRATRSMDVVASAIRHIPNADADYRSWIQIAYALWAAVGPDLSEGCALFHEWSAQSEKYDAETTDTTWSGIKSVNHSDGETLFGLARAAGWPSASDEFGMVDIDVEDLPDTPDATPADPTPKAEGSNVDGHLAKLKLSVTAFQLRTPSSIPPRQWLFDRHYIRGYVSTTVSPGGLGKSSEKLVEALAMSTGRPLLGTRPPRRLKVLYWSGEDPSEETERRLVAACAHYDIEKDEFDGNLLVADRDTLPLVLAKDGGNGVGLAKSLAKALTQFLIEERIDVLIVDPFVNTHLVSENDNAAINAVVGAWRSIAREANCAIELVHHSTKQARLPGQSDLIGIAQARGGGALIDAVRSGRFLVPMTEDEARKGGLLSHRGFYRVENGKANMAPPAEHARWRRLVSVNLGNGTSEYPHGDSVGVVEAWEWPIPTDGLPDDTLDRVKERVAAGEWRDSDQSPDWVGFAIAEVLDIDPGPVKRKDRDGTQAQAWAQCKNLLRAWKTSGDLIVEKRHSPRDGREIAYVVVGQGASAPSAP